MNARERQTVEKVSKILRATRKQNGLTQIEVAKTFGISQGALSKMENGTLMPSAPQWIEFCQLTSIPTDSLFTGYVDRLQPVSLQDDLQVGTFKIPVKYSVNRGSKVRALQPFLRYFEARMGAKKTAEYFRSVKIDPDFFVNYGNQMNLLFCLDLSEQLIERGELKAKDLPAMVQPIRLPETHGELHHHYDGHGNVLELLEILLNNAKYYECNFDYKIEERSNSTMDISVTPGSHIKDWPYRTHPRIENFLCRYKKTYFENFLRYKQDKHEKHAAGRQRPGLPVLIEKECHYKGASRCVYSISASN